MSKTAKIMLILGIVIIMAAAAVYFYRRGLTSDLIKKGGTGNPELDKEDNAFTQALWTEFTKRAGETPTWVLDLAVKKTMGEEDTNGLDSFYRINGQLTKAGALFATIQAGYISEPFNKVSAADWQYLWEMYTKWKASMNLKYA